MAEQRSYRRYNLTLIKEPPTERRKFRALSRPETYHEIRKGSIGERVAYGIDLTDREYEQARRDAEDPNSNLIAVEPNQRGRLHYEGQVPNVGALQFLAAQGAVSLGYHGAGVDVGVIDTGISAAVAGSTFAGRIKAMKTIEDPGAGSPAQPYDPMGHGTKMASLAVPPKARLAMAAADLSTEYVSKAFYWLADEVGVHVINVSLGFPNYSTVMEDAVLHAALKNVLIFASRGNEANTSPEYPAAYNGALAISAYDYRTGDPSYAYTSYGDVWAASVGDVVCWITASGAKECVSYPPSGGGTSAASALATYIAASLMTKIKSPGTVLEYLTKTARRTSAGPYYEGSGILQLSAAINALKNDKSQGKNLDDSPSGRKEGCLA